MKLNETEKNILKTLAAGPADMRDYAKSEPRFQNEDAIWSLSRKRLVVRIGDLGDFTCRLTAAGRRAAQGL